MAYYEIRIRAPPISKRKHNYIYPTRLSLEPVAALLGI